MEPLAEAFLSTSIYTYCVMINVLYVRLLIKEQMC
jgi:hypothetical protein